MNNLPKKIALAILIIGLTTFSYFVFRHEKQNATPLNVILISLDTLRADRLGVYGYARPTSPSIDKFAEQSIVFTKTVAAAPWTLPSHVSMLSGLYPSSHGITLPKKQKISPETELLAETLKKAGYKTAAITGGGYVAKHYGFDRGFDLYIHEKKASKGHKGFSASIERAKKIIESAGENPYFLFLHTYAIHCPYLTADKYELTYQSPGAEFIDPKLCGANKYKEAGASKNQALYISDRYDEGIQETDQQLAELFTYLKEVKQLDKTVVVLTSDHGEEFMEHGHIGHFKSLHKELLMIPLIIKAPSYKAAKIDAMVSTVDVTPTILDLIGRNGAQNIDGKSLRPLMDGANPEIRPFQLSESDREEKQRSSLNTDHHLILSLDEKNERLYNHRLDPQEQNNLIHIDPDIAKVMTQELIDSLPRLKVRPSEDTNNKDESPEEIEQLKTLGYM